MFNLLFKLILKLQDLDLNNTLKTGSTHLKINGIHLLRFAKTF